MCDDKNNKRGKVILQLHVSEETRNYFGDLFENREKFELARRRAILTNNHDSNATTFAGFIRPIPFNPIYVCDDEKASCVVERDSKNIESDSKVLSKRPPRTYWRGNQKNK